MKYIFLNAFKAFFCLVLIFTAFSAKAMDFPKDGEEFRRTAANSPIFLKFSKSIKVNNYGLSLSREGFNIYLYDEKPERRQCIGYITFTLDESRKVIEFTWVKVNPNAEKMGYATEALRTAMGVLKKRKPEFFPWATHYFLSVGNSVGPAMKRVAEKNGFQVSKRFWHPETMTDYEKLILE
ncbi:MAG: GNAT family N-acetyltransferase [Proteobacteria bacterium]|nr:GNAT family N-acetyltransferase [Pseudomonadota bacterium]